MLIEFFKYEGTGNDFILIDNRQNQFDKNDSELISSMCARRTGIGADGLILLENHEQFDFRMIYFNSDGKESSMCGNGGRCITDFSRRLGIISNKTNFLAIDGIHEAYIKKDIVCLKMQDVSRVNYIENHFVIDTGSPHLIVLTENLESIDLNTEGQKINKLKSFKDKGINVNFLQFEEKKSNTLRKKNDIGIRVRTYGRGVCEETLSCGTGVVACAIMKKYLDDEFKKHDAKNLSYTIQTMGGNLIVTLDFNNNLYQNIWLSGPVRMLYQAQFKC